MVHDSSSRRRLGSTCLAWTILFLAGATLAHATPGGGAASAVGREPQAGLLAHTAPLTTPTPTPGPAAAYVGRLGAFVRVADACSYYPLAQCDGTVVQISESTPGQLTAYVGKDVRVETVTAECGSSIAGRPLYGPVAVRAQLVGPCAPSVQPVTCPGLDRRVPAAVINAAMANPSTIQGWGQPCNPALPVGVANPLRRSLSLVSPGKPFHPTYNSVVYKCGCP